MDDRAIGERLGLLARHLETLASPTRLALLHALRTPRSLADIRVRPTLTREGEREDRPLSRQAVTHHLEQLLDAGLVRRLSDDARDTFVLSHDRLFALVDEMRDLTRLRPYSAWSDSSETLGREDARPATPPPRPCLAVAYGQAEGSAFPLAGAVGSTWRLGRRAQCEVRLDHDPYVSAEHAVVERREDGYFVADQGSRNGTLLDGVLLSPGAAVGLRPGSILTVGRSVLVFQG